MKVLLISHRFAPEIGGIETMSKWIADTLSEQKFRVKVLTHTPSKNEESVPYQIIRKPGFFRLLYLHLWADIVLENNPSLRLSWPSFILRKKNITVLQTWLNRPNGTLGWQDRLKKWCLGRAKSVIAVSESLSKRIWPKAMVIHNTYQAELFRVFPGVSKTKSFVFLGRLVSDKGAELAILAFFDLLSELPDYQKSTYHLTIIGDGPERGPLEKLAQQFDITEQVIFRGSLVGEELVNTLNEHQFLLVPSIWEEPFGIVALEGMACGCVPLVSDGGGLPDAVGQAGLIFKRGDVPALKSAMREVLNNAELLAKLREAAIDHLAHHHPERIAAQYLQVIESVAREKHQ